MEQGFQERTGVTKRCGALEMGPEGEGGRVDLRGKFRPWEFGKEVGSRTPRAPHAWLESLDLTPKLQELENKFWKNRQGLDDSASSPQTTTSFNSKSELFLWLARIPYT